MPAETSGSSSLGFLKDLIDLYKSLGTSPDDIRDKAMRPIFIDLFSGTGSMATHSKYFSYDAVKTLDNNPDNDADFQYDIMDIGIDTGGADGVADALSTYIRQRMKEGHMIVFHASPPCNQFSRMNTNGEKDIEEAMKLVEKAHMILRTYSAIWTIENPKTGTLWNQPYALDNFIESLYHDVDYCAYGGIMKKSTRFLFSTTELHGIFQPKVCPGSASCTACIASNNSSYRRVHANWSLSDYSERITIPPQLCMSIHSALIEYSKDVAGKIADALMSVENTQKRRRESGAFSGAGGRYVSGMTPYADIAEKDVIVYLATGFCAKDTLHNIGATYMSESDKNMSVGFIAGINVDRLVSKVVDDDGSDIYVFYGRPYIGTLDRMMLLNNYGYFAIPNDFILLILSPNSNEKIELFKISEKRKQGIIDNFMEM